MTEAEWQAWCDATADQDEPSDSEDEEGYWDPEDQALPGSEAELAEIIAESDQAAADAAAAAAYLAGQGKARVERWPEFSGNAALVGRELPPAQVLAADQRIGGWARQLKAAGLEGSMDELRAQAYLDLLLGTDSRPRGTGPQPGHTDSQPGPASADGACPGGPVPGVVPAGFVGRVNLTATLATLLGLADRPGEIAGIGPIDPWLARDLAAAAARNPATTWCVTVTDNDGHAIGHGCARPEPKTTPDTGTNIANPARRTGVIRRAGPGTGTGAGSPSRRRAGTGPPGGYGSWWLRTGGNGPDLIIDLDPLPTGDCDHRFEANGHDPGVKLRHLSQVRHATCTAPTCRRPASQCDFEHNIPYEAGGRSCLCNTGPKCRHDHRLKQHPGWKVEQLPDSTFRWTTPSGRQYTTEPTRYPI